MKNSAIVLGFLLLVGCATVQTDEVSAGHVIVPASEQDDFVATGKEWTPDDKIIARVEKEIGLLFAHPDRRLKGVLTRDASPPRKAPYRLSDYYVRYCGISSEGKKLIIGKGVHREVADPKIVLRALVVGGSGRSNSVLKDLHAGGGTYFFTATFDAGSRSLLTLSYNAPL